MQSAKKKLLPVNKGVKMSNDPKDATVDWSKLTRGQAPVLTPIVSVKITINVITNKKINRR